MRRIEKVAQSAGRYMEVELAGVKWTEAYGTYTALIAGWIPVTLAWDSGAFHIRVANRALKTSCSSSPEAAAHAVKTAKSWVAKAAAELEAK